MNPNENPEIPKFDFLETATKLRQLVGLSREQMKAYHESNGSWNIWKQLEQTDNDIVELSNEVCAETGVVFAVTDRVSGSHGSKGILAAMIAEEAEAIGFSIDKQDEELREQTTSLLDDLLNYKNDHPESDDEKIYEYHTAFEFKRTVKEKLLQSSVREMLKRDGSDGTSPILYLDTIKAFSEKSGIDMSEVSRDIKDFGPVVTNLGFVGIGRGPTQQQQVVVHPSNYTPIKRS